jgi:hypothetical protein
MGIKSEENPDKQINNGLIKKRNPQMNNTHTSGVVESRKVVLGITNYRTGI